MKDNQNRAWGPQSSDINSPEPRGRVQPISDNTTVPQASPMDERMALIKSLLPENNEELEKEIQQGLDRVWEAVEELDPRVSIYVLNKCLVASQKKVKALLTQHIEELSSQLELASSRLEDTKYLYLKLERLEGLC